MDILRHAGFLYFTSIFSRGADISISIEAAPSTAKISNLLFIPYTTYYCVDHTLASAS